MQQRHLFYSLALIFFLSFALAAPQVRVLLGEADTAITVQVVGAHNGYIDGSARFFTPFALSWPISAYYDQIYIDGNPVGHTFMLEPADANLLSWNGKQYRGALSFVAEGQRLKIINVVDLEVYLRGVVAAEMQASWPIEALKAQAIAARTYTLYQLDPSAAYDVCATGDCQKYGGVSAEQPQSDQAILATEGVVVTYGGEYAQTYYHSDSGGVLASSAEVWGGKIPYLVSQKDAESRTPHRYWTIKLDPGLMASSLQARGKALGSIQGLRVLSYSESGRVIQAEVQGSQGKAVLSGLELRQVLRDWGFKSTRFRMLSDLVVEGNGWGHGVGMSQYGARALAEAGYSYLQILAFYYPTTSFQHLNYVVSATQY